LFFNVSSPENVLEIDPLLLANDPFFNNLVESEQVLFELLGLLTKWLYISATKNHVDSSEAFVKSLEDYINFINNQGILVFVLLDDEIDLLPVFI
jgi:hypothetical protein